MFLQLLDVLLREQLIEKLVADPSRRIAGALFVAPENGKFDSRLIEKLRERRVTIEAEFLAAFRRAEDPMSRLQERRQIGGE